MLPSAVYGLYMTAMQETKRKATKMTNTQSKSFLNTLAEAVLFKKLHLQILRSLKNTCGQKEKLKTQQLTDILKHLAKYSALALTMKS